MLPQNFQIVLQAFSKFQSMPVSTRLHYSYGDDEMGNVTFPTVTICTHPFTQFDTKGICFDRHQGRTFHDEVTECDQTESDQTRHYALLESDKALFGMG
jgi:hypothetical protein